EFLAGCHSEDNPSPEANPKVRYWTYAIFKSSGDNNYQKVWDKRILGYNPLSTFQSGCSSGDLDNDGRPEIIISTYPNLYIVDYNEDDKEYNTVWHYTQSRTSRFVINDLDNNGINELFFNNGEKITVFEKDIYIPRPDPPVNFTAEPVDTNSVILKWDYNSDFDNFRIYRGESRDSLENIGHISPTLPQFNLEYWDRDVEEGVTYRYAVSAVDSAFANMESQLSEIVSAKPNEYPYIEEVRFVPDNKIMVTFSEPMSKSVIDESNYKITPENLSFASAAYSQSGREVLLTVESDFYESGEYILIISNKVKDVDKTSLGFHETYHHFNIVFESNPPYLKEVETEGNYITLTYNVPMDESTT
ncbi:Ig-like domain-containing protein, partial [bacterium]|nr:Ig-like domain-containing protein [bacterium]